MLRYLLVNYINYARVFMVFSQIYFVAVFLFGHLTPRFFAIRERGKIWVIAVRMGSYQSLFLGNSGCVSLEKMEN